MKAASHEQIERRAYEIWERQGRPHGFDKEHWDLAERELLEEAPAVAPNLDLASHSSAAAASFAAGPISAQKPAPMGSARPPAPTPETPRRSAGSSSTP